MEKKRIEEDLRLTLGELSATYEELTLLYRLTEALSGQSVEEICRTVLSEALQACGLDTGGIALFAPDKRRLNPVISIGGWDDGLIRGENEKTIRALFDGGGHHVHVFSLNGSRLVKGGAGLPTALVCPLMGKREKIGVLMASDSREREFFSAEMKLMAAITTHASLFIENALLYEKTEEFFLNITASYVKALESSSTWTAGHTERVTEYALSIGTEMGFDEEALKKLRTTCLLHDIGKIFVRPTVLNKPGKLTLEEWAEIRSHPIIGADILGEIKALSDIAESVRSHHEYWDGSGMLGIKGDEIPLMARILSVADAFDAMMSSRPYRPCLNTEDCVAELRDNSGTQFDPDIIVVFMKVIDKNLLLSKNNRSHTFKPE